MPRGRKPADDPRNLLITVRLTAAEYRYLQVLAMKHGRPLGEVVRFLALGGMPRPQSSSLPPFDDAP
jgi:hypothetical protein